MPMSPVPYYENSHGGDRLFFGFRFTGSPVDPEVRFVSCFSALGYAHTERRVDNVIEALKRDLDALGVKAKRAINRRVEARDRRNEMRAVGGAEAERAKAELAELLRCIDPNAPLDWSAKRNLNDGRT